MVCRVLSGKESIESGSVQQKDIRPPVRVVIEKGNSGTSGLENIFFAGFSSEVVSELQSGFRRYVRKVIANIRDFRIRPSSFGISDGRNSNGRNRETQDSGYSHPQEKSRTAWHPYGCFRSPVSSACRLWLNSLCFFA